MAAAGRPLPNFEFVPHLLTGLGPAYDPLVSSVTTRLDAISSSRLFGHLLAHETRLLHHSETNDFSANYTAKHTPSSSQKYPSFPRDRGVRWGRNNYRGHRHSTRGRGFFLAIPLSLLPLLIPL